MMIKTIQTFVVPGYQEFEAGKTYVVDEVLGENLIERMCAVKHEIKGEQLVEAPVTNSRKK